MGVGKVFSGNQRNAARKKKKKEKTEEKGGEKIEKEKKDEERRLKRRHPKWIAGQADRGLFLIRFSRRTRPVTIAPDARQRFAISSLLFSFSFFSASRPRQRTTRRLTFASRANIFAGDAEFLKIPKAPREAVLCRLVCTPRGCICGASAARKKRAATSLRADLKRKMTPFFSF